jgi:hypothetical protein
VTTLSPDGDSLIAAKMRRARLRKTIRNRNKDHLAFVAAQLCLICQRTPCDAHYLKFAQPRSLGARSATNSPFRSAESITHCIAMAAKLRGGSTAGRDVSSIKRALVRRQPAKAWSSTRT